jgi:hypothetical protein
VVTGKDEKFVATVIAAHKYRCSVFLTLVDHETKELSVMNANQLVFQRKPEVDWTIRLT